MDSIILLGQNNTLAEYMILSGAENRPPMLDKDLYDSWKSRMELYMQNREHGRMMLELVENGPLMRYFAFGTHLEEIHVTWTHLEKKQTRLWTYTNIAQEFLYSG
ncbi:hypothetical protein Tco_0362646 [Tanacetum coccineum]